LNAQRENTSADDHILGLKSRGTNCRQRQEVQRDAATHLKKAVNDFSVVAWPNRRFGVF
jgi:hypothetical protein